MPRLPKPKADKPHKIDEIMHDALAYGTAMHETLMPTDTRPGAINRISPENHARMYEQYVRSAQSMSAVRWEAAQRAERARGRSRFLEGIRVRFEPRHDRDATMMTSTIDGGHSEALTVQSMLDARDMLAGNANTSFEEVQRRNEVIRRTVHEHAQRYARIIEEQLMRQCERALADPHYYGRSPAMAVMDDMALHARDIVGGFFGGLEKPERPEPIKCLQGYPYQEIQWERFKATLMADTMRLWEESDKLSHCLYKSYTPRIQGGNYIVFHVDADHLSKHGFTLGFRRQCSATPWEIDQCKGRKNNRHPDMALDAFCKHVLNVINGAKP